MMPVLLAIAVCAVPVTHPAFTVSGDATVTFPVAQPVLPRQLSVVGNAKVTFLPNQVRATVVLSSTQQDQTSARRTCDEKLRTLLGALQAAGVEERNLLVHEQSVVKDNRGRETLGFIATRSITLTITDMARVDEAFIAAVEAGAHIDDLAWVSNSEQVAFETKARIAAAAVARERALGMVEALGARLGLPRSVADQTQQSSPGNRYHWGSSPTGIHGTRDVFANWRVRNEIAVSSQVTVVFDVQEAPSPAPR